MQAREKTKAVLFLILIAAFIIRLIVVHANPFTYEWDERFHALVAKNMMADPLKPVLHRHPVMPFAFWLWADNYVWLHKPPLFLWQMALSMKIFGVTEYAGRYPSVLMGTIMVLLIYRVGDLLTKNKNIAFLAAALFSVSFYQLRLTAGYDIDHDDVSFGFYVLLSVWAYSEYVTTRKLKWVIWIGVFAGCAILNKWLTGLLVYLGWGVNILLTIRQQGAKKEIGMLLLSLLICCVVFLPWQIYIHWRFPVEALTEMEYNTRHVFEVVEHHYGTVWYYLGNLDMYFGNGLWILLLIGMVVAARIATDKKMYVALIVIFLAVICFFSFIVQTKMPAFIFVVAPIGFVFIAIAAVSLLQYLRGKASAVVYVIISLILCYITLDIGRMSAQFSSTNTDRNHRIHNINVYKSLRKRLPTNIRFIFNAKGADHVDVMFYNDAEAYNYYPDSLQFLRFARRGIPIAVFKDGQQQVIPTYIKRYPHLFVINDTIY
ncbi:MAG: ArnT family glycosyltransferase [Flavipsychrobacter sp.]